MRRPFAINRLLLVTTIFTVELFGCSKGSNPDAMPAALTVSSLSSSRGSVGDTLIINGTKFRSVSASNSVQLNATDVVVIKATTTQLSVQLPTNIAIGSLTVSVTRSSDS
jgi:hypothetical protein